MTVAVDAVLDATGLQLTEVWLQGSAAWRIAPFQAVMALVGGLLVLCTVAMAWGGALSGPMPAVRVRRGLATWLMVTAIVAFAVWIAWAFFIDRGAPVVPPSPADAKGLSGMVVAPTSIAAVGALIATASMSWGYGRPIQFLCGALIIAALGIAMLATLRPHHPNATIWTATAILVVAAVLASYLPLVKKENRVRARYAGWRGNGAAVALLVAWFSSLVITSLLVLGAYSWLSTTTENPDTRAHLRTVRDAATENLRHSPRRWRCRSSTPASPPCSSSSSRSSSSPPYSHWWAERKFPAFSLPGLISPMTRRRSSPRRRNAMNIWAEYSCLVPRGSKGRGLDRAVREVAHQAVPVDDYPRFEHRPGGRCATWPTPGESPPSRTEGSRS